MLKQNHTKGGKRLDLKKSSITADILNVLADGKTHTMLEIAQQVEVCQRTVRRHIQSLSYRYPIETFCGGIERGGVRLDKKYIQNGKIRTKTEIELLKQGLTLLHEKIGADATLLKLLQEFGE